MFIDEYFKFQKSVLKTYEQIVPKAKQPKNMSPQNWEEMIVTLMHFFYEMTVTIPGFGEACGFDISSKGELLCKPWHLDSFMVNFYRAPQEIRGIYKIAEHFGKQLHKTRADFPLKQLQNMNRVMIIEFPESVDIRNKEGHRSTAALVTLDASKGMSLVFPEKKDGEPLHSGDYYFWKWDRPDFDPDATFAEMFEKDDKEHITTSVTAEMLLFAVKCVVYIFSREPDLSEYRPLPTAGVPKKERDRNRSVNEKTHGQHPLQLVGYSWQQSRQWHVNEIYVSGHFRWQPCGPQKSQVTLIWIDEYTKNVKKGE